MKVYSVGFLLILLALFIAPPSSVNLSAYDYQVIFSDDFQSGSTQNWLQENGIWSASGFQFCVEDCAS